jgi:hypothetical protein
LVLAALTGLLAVAMQSQAQGRGGPPGPRLGL